MRFSIRTYIVISIVCFLSLLAVQLFLVYNTYELKNERYYFKEKNDLKEKYDKTTTNDKLFPGGQRVIDSFIHRNLMRLETMHHDHPEAVVEFRQKLMDSIVRSLLRIQSVDKFLQQYKKNKKIEDSLEYALVFTTLDLKFNDKNYISIYSHEDNQQFAAPARQIEKGIRLAGTLTDLNKQNEVTGIIVSSPQSYTYRTGWALHVEPVNRQATILKEMGVILALSLLSITIIISLFFVTFRNWLRQKQLSEMKSDFINNVTHELHTPLATIAVANKNLQNEKIIEKRENIRPLTEIIQRQSDRLSTLISQVLDIASSSKITLDKKTYSIHNLLDETLLDFRLKSGTSNINLTFDKGATKDTVLLDKFHFTSIILNLLDNAIKYNTNAIKTVVVSTSSNGDNIQLMVSDNGTGMNRETLHNIFDKFYRNTHTLNNYPVKGLGLGLYYVKQSIRAHHWDITVKSKPGEGSSFIITIPFQNEVK